MDRNGMLNIAVVGAAGQRAAAFKLGIESTGRARVKAVCDVNCDKLDDAAALWGVKEKFTDYQEMLEKADVDVVMIGTPSNLHASQAIYALQNGKHVYSEIPAGLSMDECRQLVESCKTAKGSYVMGENVCYMKEYMVIEEMVNRGLFGELYFAQGEYLHDLKKLFETSRWRRDLLVGVNGITYGTHSIGPILEWMKGDRITRLSCTGTGHHYVDENSRSYAQENGCLMLANTVQGRTVEIRVDMLSTRPYGLNFRLQGTKGTFESIHDWTGGRTRMWAEDICGGGDREKWVDFSEIEKDYIPEIWRDVPKSVVQESTHWGIDYVTIREYIGYLYGQNVFKAGIHEAMDMTLPGLVSQESICEDGKWLEVPDTRNW